EGHGTPLEERRVALRDDAVELAARGRGERLEGFPGRWVERLQAPGRPPPSLYALSGPAIAQRNGISEMSACEALGIHVKQAMHLAHRVLGGSAARVRR